MHDYLLEAAKKARLKHLKSQAAKYWLMEGKKLETKGWIIFFDNIFYNLNLK